MISAGDAYKIISQYSEKEVKRMSTFVTKPVRLSFPHLFEPSAAVEGGVPKYSVVCLIDKKDKATIDTIMKAVAEAKAKFKEKTGKTFKQEGMPNTVHDGDGQRPNGEDFGPECAGCYVVRMNSTNPPVVINRMKEPITDPREVYAGCYGVVNFACGVYDMAGNRGIAFYLNGVAKVNEGEPLAASSPQATMDALVNELDENYSVADDEMFAGTDNDD